MRYALLICALIPPSFSWSLGTQVSYKDFHQFLASSETKLTMQMYAGGAFEAFSAANAKLTVEEKPILYCMPPSLQMSTDMIIGQTEVYFKSFTSGMSAKDRSSLAEEIPWATFAIEEVAEGQGFEPWKGLTLCWFSRPVHSTALPSLHTTTHN